MTPSQIQSAINTILDPYGFVALPPQGPGSMGGWCAEYMSDEFRVYAAQDRSGDTIQICVGSRIRRKPRAHMRGPWSLSHMRGYLDGIPDHYLFGDIEEQIAWFRANLATLLQTSLLNSDELNQWAGEAARRRFG